MSSAEHVDHSSPLHCRGLLGDSENPPEVAGSNPVGFTTNLHDARTHDDTCAKLHEYTGTHHELTTMHCVRYIAFQD
jgi:hypothetical protein